MELENNQDDPKATFVVNSASKEVNESNKSYLRSHKKVNYKELDGADDDSSLIPEDEEENYSVEEDKMKNKSHKAVTTIIFTSFEDKNFKRNLG